MSVGQETPGETGPSTPGLRGLRLNSEPGLLRSPEGRILKLGLALGVVYLLGMAGVWLFSPSHASDLGALTALNVVAGRAAGMSLGYAKGLQHSIVVPANMLIESIQVMVVYPLFVFSWRHLLEIRALKSFMARIRKTAEARRGLLRRYGMVGLFIFVFIPFWMTGPVVGSVVGFLIGLRPWVTMVTVLSATYIAIGLWAVMLQWLSGLAATYNQYAPFGLVGALIIVVWLGRCLRRRFPAP